MNKNVTIQVKSWHCINHKVRVRAIDSDPMGFTGDLIAFANACDRLGGCVRGLGATVKEFSEVLHDNLKKLHS